MNTWPEMRPMADAPKDRAILVRWDRKATSGKASGDAYGYLIVKRAGRNWIDCSDGAVVLRPSGFWLLPGDNGATATEGGGGWR